MRGAVQAMAVSGVPELQRVVDESRAQFTEHGVVAAMRDQEIMTTVWPPTAASSIDRRLSALAVRTNGAP